jgi:hypothetical protein
MTGDAEGQPVESVDALDDLAAALEPEQEAPETLDESEQEDADESEADDDAEEEQEADEDDEDEAEEKSFTIKVDGKEITLTESELIERAQKGTDYSNKTMAVAEERKAVAAEREQVTQVRTQAEQALEETSRRLQAYSQYIESQVGQMPDASMLDYDTAGYLRQKEQYEARKGQLQQTYAALQHLQDEQARQRQAWIAERAEATEKVLADTLPGWNDNTLNDLSGYTQTLGLNPETAGDALLSPGFWQMAQKAKAYDAIQSKKAEMKPTQKLAKVAKPTAVNTTGKAAERAKREAAFNKNPSVDALADLIR